MIPFLLCADQATLKIGFRVWKPLARLLFARDSTWAHAFVKSTTWQC
jgi:hypothetical protein